MGLALLAVPHVSADYEDGEYGEDDDYAGEDYGEEGYGEDDGDNEEDEHVVVLTATNFEELVLNKPYALVEFYAPWCGHCKEIAPQYAAAATEIFAHDPLITIGKVDATVHAELAEEYGVEGYPTIKWFKNGKVSDYSGGRDAEGFTTWVLMKTGPPSVLVETADELTKLTKKNEVVVLGLFSKNEGPEYESFIEIATSEGMDAVQFVHTTNDAVAATLGLKAGPTAMILRDFDSGNVQYEGDLKDKEVFAALVNKYKLPLVIPFNEKNAEKIFDSNIDKQVLVFGSSDDLEDGLKIAGEVSAEFAGSAIFVSVNTDEKETADVLEFFGLTAATPGMQVMGFTVVNEQGVKYRFTEEFSLDNLKKFTSALVADELEPDFKSEPIPEKNDMPVTVVVGKTFAQIVMDETKDVLLEVYAPWCGHCKELAPTYKKLGKRFASVDSVVIAKMDGTANEHPLIADKVQGYPTVLFYPAGADKEPINVEEDRTLSGLTKFIKQHATIEFELTKKKKEEKEEL